MVPVLTGLCGLLVWEVELVLTVLLELLECMRAAAYDITFVSQCCKSPGGKTLLIVVIRDCLLCCALSPCTNILQALASDFLTCSQTWLTFCQGLPDSLVGW